MKPYEIAEQGIARTFQNIALLRYDDCRKCDDRAPAYAQEKLLLAASTGWPALEEEVKHRRRCEEIIDFLEIQPIRNTPVSSLPTDCKSASNLRGLWRWSQNYCYLMNLWLT